MSSNLPRDQQPDMLDRIKLRWWLYAIVPIALALYAATQGWIPVALVALVIFCLVFWLISFVTALIVLLRGRSRRNSLNKDRRN